MLRRRTALIGLAGLPFALFAGRSASGEAGLETVTTNAADGRQLTAFLAVPSKTPAPAVLMLHGFHGLSDWYKSTAIEFAKQGFVGLVFNYHAGIPSENIPAWAQWLKHDQRTNGKLAIVGYSSGAELALRSSVSIPVDATVLYVGMDELTVDELTHLKGPVLGQFSDRGVDPNPDNVKRLEGRMKEAGKSFEIHWYAANHGFMNPEFADYNKEAADASWASTIEFLHRNLH
jgi:carboxymethylenebutenolidase